MVIAEARRIAVFLVVGGTNTVIGLAMMATLQWLTGNPFLSNAVSYFIGFFLSFWWHDRFTFGDIEDKHERRILGYLVVYVLSFLANFLALAVCVDGLHIAPFPSFVISSAVFAAVSYGLNRLFVFAPGAG